jgi:UDP-glucuronate decarboxylase
MKYKFWMVIFTFVFWGLYSQNIDSIKKTVLVTGGAGFLGSHMCERLVQKEYNVICLDDMSTGTKENIKDLLSFDNFTLIQQDVTQPLNIDCHVDEIYNFACPASPVQYQENPIKTFRTNVLGAINMLELARKNNAKIFQASTSEIYGDPLTHPQKETDWGNVNPIGYRSCYDEGKRAAETIFFDYYRTYKIRIKIGRIFNTYGTNMLENDGRVISNFIVQALNNQPITIYGKGLQTRSFCYVDDLIDAIITLMEKTEDEFIGPINLGNPDEYTIVELAEKVIKLTDSNSMVVYEVLPFDDPKRRKPDTTCAEKFLNWRPEITIDEGLKKTITYFKEILK